MASQKQMNGGANDSQQSSKSSAKAPFKVPKPLKDGSVPEKVIQRQILDWLKETGLLHWRQNSGTVFVGARCIKLGEEGLPDIVVVVPPSGRFVGLEVKSAVGYIRPKQKEFMTSCHKAGAEYFIVRSLSQAMAAMATVLGDERWKQLQASVTARTGRPS